MCTLIVTELHVLSPGTQFLIIVSNWGTTLWLGNPRNKPLFAISSAEAEYPSMEVSISKVVWINGLLNELRLSIIEPTILHCDNKGVIQIARNSMFHERTKHIEINCHFVRENIQDGTIIPSHVNTKDQLVTVVRDLQLYSILKFEDYNVFS